MKQIKSLAAVALLAAITSQTSVFGLTVTDFGTTAPTEITYGQTASGGTAVPPTNSTQGATHTAQTFNLGSLAGIGGYYNSVELTNIYVKANGNINPIASGLSWTLSIGTVDTVGNKLVFNTIDSESFTSSGSFGKKDFIQFTLSNYVTLAANTDYAFSISTTGGNVKLEGTSTPSFTGDITGLGASVNAAGTITESTGSSRLFYIDTVPVPEPMNWAIVPVLGTLAFFGFRRLRSSSVA